MAKAKCKKCATLEAENSKLREEVAAKDAELSEQACNLKIASELRAEGDKLRAELSEKDAELTHQETLNKQLSDELASANGKLAEVSLNAHMRGRGL